MRVNFAITRRWAYSIYVIYDPQQILFNDPIRVYQLVAREYLLRPDYRLLGVDLSLTLWYGMFEDKRSLWLRWSDQMGNLILTGAERAKEERQRAEEERQRAEEANVRAEQAQQRADRFAAQLRALRIEPDGVPRANDR